MSRANMDIRMTARRAGVMLWQVAGELGVSEATLTRRLRTELDGKGKTQLFEAIQRISGREAVSNEDANNS